MALLKTKELVKELENLPDWEIEGASISKTFQAKDFPNAILFVNAVAQVAEKVWHHPDIDVRWNKVRLKLSTHDQGGLTAKDFELARLIESLAPTSNSDAP